MQFLVKRGADLFAENENKETPCDCAERQHHKELALSLESQMVFSSDPHAEDIEAEYAGLDRREVSSPNKLWNILRHQDIDLRTLCPDATDSNLHDLRSIKNKS